jgi:hypothetical protein
MRSTDKLPFSCVKKQLVEQIAVTRQRAVSHRTRRPWRPLLYWRRKGFSKAKVLATAERKDSPSGKLYQLPLETVDTADSTTFAEQLLCKTMEKAKKAAAKRKARRHNCALCVY